MDRRKFLTATTGIAVGSMIPSAALGTRSMLLNSDNPVFDAKRWLAFYDEKRRAGEPADRVRIGLLQHAYDIEETVSRVSDPVVKRELLSIEAQAFGKAGITAFNDLGLQRAADKHLRLGMQAARRARNFAVYGWLQIRQGHRLLYDMAPSDKSNFHDALWTADNAARWAEGNPFLSADLLYVKACAYAALDNRDMARRALNDASMLIASADLYSAPEWAKLQDPFMSLYATSGIAHLWMNSPQHAFTDLEHAMSRTRDDQAHNAFLLALSAKALTAFGEPEHAAHRLSLAIPVATRQRSVIRLNAIHDARRALNRWKREPFVRRLDQQLQGI